MVYFKSITSSIGVIRLESDGTRLTGLYLSSHKDKTNKASIIKNFKEAELQVFHQADTQIQEYFSGERQNFNIPIHLFGTEFQKKVWLTLVRIPYGNTISYKELAIQILHPKSFRAVGQANGSNPISIILPCHRVIGSDGSLTGYGGGIEIKEVLLKFENYVRANGPHRLVDTPAYDLLPLLRS